MLCSFPMLPFYFFSSKTFGITLDSTVGLLLDNRTYHFLLFFAWLLIYYLNTCSKISNEGIFFLINKVLTLFLRSYLLEDNNDWRLQFHPLTIIVRGDCGGMEKDCMLEERIIQRCVWKFKTRVCFVFCIHFLFKW